MVRQFIENNKEQMIKDLAILVSYNSVLADDAKPFGLENKKVLDATLKMMDNYGLKTKNLDYYCGYGEIGDGEDIVGILAHLDIVPSGEGWDSDPFELTLKDGVLYGRGTSDDKGAVIASLYAMKYLKEINYPLKKRVRLITGCNEETGSKCIKHYVEKEGHISVGFTPDGNFPGIYAEAGMIGAKIHSSNSKIININGGDASNIVCKKVICEVPIDSYNENKLNNYFSEYNIQYNVIKTEQTITLTVFGKAAHASMPDEGINAISYLMEALYHADFQDELVNYYHDKIALTTHGEIIGANLLDDGHTPFTFNVGMVSKNDDIITFSVDMRFPVTKTVKELSDLLIDKLNLGNNKLAIISTHEPLFFDIDTPMVKAMHKAYVDVTNDTKHKMQAIGGGTYAKAINNCIAFGCEFPNVKANIHDANECLEVEHLLKQVEIYIEAIKNLNEV